MLLEVCVDSVDGLMSAFHGGADRVELCSALECGGLTPSSGLLKQAKLLAPDGRPVFAMIRPRAGNFVYSERELETMEADIDAVREMGLTGVVFGASRDDGSGRLDEIGLTRLAKRAQGLGKTLHRCFDLVPDLGEAVELAISLGFDRILTSGRAPAAIPDGLEDLSEMVRLAERRISIMPGAGIRAENLPILMAKVPFIVEVHASCSETTPPDDPNLVSAFGFENETGRKGTSVAEVRKLRNTMDSDPLIHNKS